MEPRPGYIHIKRTSGIDIIRAVRRASGSAFHIVQRYGYTQVGLIGRSAARRLIILAENNPLIAEDARYSVLQIKWEPWSSQQTRFQVPPDEITMAIDDFVSDLKAELGDLVKS